MLSSNMDSTLNHDQRYKTWLPETKTKIFKKLFDEMAENLGGVYKAKDFIGLSGKTLDDLYKEKISVDTAKKILSAHKKLIKK